MSLPVFYTAAAKDTLYFVYTFIKEKFGARAADKFIIKAEKTISLIAEYPYMFKASPIDENIRVALITKQTSLFYQVSENSIDLLFFWDNRQEPMLE